MKLIIQIYNNPTTDQPERFSLIVGEEGQEDLYHNQFYRNGIAAALALCGILANKFIRPIETETDWNRSVTDGE